MIDRVEKLNEQTMKSRSESTTGSEARDGGRKRQQNCNAIHVATQRKIQRKMGWWVIRGKAIPGDRINRDGLKSKEKKKHRKKIGTTNFYCVYISK